MKMISNFDEFEGEIIKYSDYIAEELTESLNQIPVGEPPIKAWTVEDSQQLSSQIVGVKHPWTRDQYEKFAHPEVKKDISYEEYITMWNMKAPDDQRVILEKSGRGFNVDRMPTKKKLETVRKPRSSYSSGTSGSSGKTYSELPGPTLYDRNSDRPFKINYDQKGIVNPLPKEPKEPSMWSKIRLESRIMIIFMIVGVFLSFLTVLILLFK